MAQWQRDLIYLREEEKLARDVYLRLYDKWNLNRDVRDRRVDGGATIEDLDIYDIDEMRKHTDDPAIVALYDSLACASRNHMRSYYGQLQQKSVTYQPQHISQSALDAIVAVGNESCGGGGGK